MTAGGGQGRERRRASVLGPGLLVALVCGVGAWLALANPGHGPGSDPGRPAAGVADVRVASVPRAQRSAAGIPPTSSGRTPGIHHYLYVFPDRSMSVYDIDHGHALVQHRSFPSVRGVRGVAFAPSTRTLYLTYGNDRVGPGSVMAYDPVTDQVKWTRTYNFGIDSMAISPDGRRIYMPGGELSGSGTWRILDARSGAVIGRIEGGRGPHNTIAAPDGSRVYLGGRDFNYLEVASAATNAVIKRIGPLKSGVRPFTINGRQTLAFTTATGFLGFQVSSIATGRVLFTKSFRGFSWDPATFSASAPSHGISLSPNEREAWVIDGPNSYVHAFDVSGLPRKSPRPVANIRLPDPLSGKHSDCFYDCERDGWLLHSRDGRYLYVGDSGDVMDAIHHRPIVELPALRETRVFIEVDFQNGAPTATTTRSGMGYVRG